MARVPSMDIHGVLTFDPVRGGTRMRWSWSLTPRGALKLLTPAIGRMGRRQEQTVRAGLKRVLETPKDHLPAMIRGSIRIAGITAPAGAASA